MSYYISALLYWERIRHSRPNSNPTVVALHLCYLPDILFLDSDDDCSSRHGRSAQDPSPTAKVSGTRPTEGASVFGKSGCCHYLKIVPVRRPHSSHTPHSLHAASFHFTNASHSGSLVARDRGGAFYVCSVRTTVQEDGLSHPRSPAQWNRYSMIPRRSGIYHPFIGPSIIKC